MLRYEIDPNHTNVGFSAKHLAVSTVHGHFSKFDGFFEGPDDDYTKARGEVKIDVASLSTKTDQIEHVEGDTYKVKGDLTIKETTRPITLEATIEGRVPDPFGGKERLGVSAKGQINRMDFGLNWDGIAGAVPLAGHTIKLEIDAEIVVKVAEAAQVS